MVLAPENSGRGSNRVHNFVELLKFQTLITLLVSKSGFSATAVLIGGCGVGVGGGVGVGVGAVISGLVTVTEVTALTVPIATLTV